MAPAFWRPALLGVESAWYGHLPFAFWLMAHMRPRLVVELGTQHGVSYAGFCHAVERLGLPTRCFAVDTWKGDRHSGEYGEEVFQELTRFHERYRAFSTLLRMTFNEAAESFLDESIDLLHLDGEHSYESVRSDFETWRPKLSPRAVALFHDTNVRDRGFGVWRLWSELRQRYPGFEFSHASGLGVLALGPDVPGPVADLCNLEAPEDCAAVRERFAVLGERWEYETRYLITLRDAASAVESLKGESAARGDAEAALRHAREELDRARLLEQRLSELEGRLAEAEENLRRARAAETALQGVLSGRDRDLAETRIELERVCSAEAALRRVVGQREGELVQARSNEARAVADLERARSREGALQRTLDEREGDLARVRTGLERARLSEQRSAQAVRELERELAETRNQVARLEQESAGLLDSTFWRALAPVRAAAHRIPPRARHSIRDLFIGPPRLVASSPVDQVPEPPTRTQRHPAQPSVVFISGEPETPGHAYRVLRYMEAARAAGAASQWATVAEAAAAPEQFRGALAVIIWRACHTAELEALIAAAREGGGRIVVDIDDLMFRPELATQEIIDGIRSQGFAETEVQGHFAAMLKTLSEADLCTCPTEELAHQIRAFQIPALVRPNGFDTAQHRLARRELRRRRQLAPDGLIRIGYAGGSRTHQRDFGQVAEAVAELLARRRECRLVLFESSDRSLPLIDVEEFPALAARSEQIEWRRMVPVEALPAELARFDINIAPLEVGNPFCEAKSELKYYEAALVEVPTIASPTGPFARAIRHGETGFLASSPEEWSGCLERLAADAGLRRRVGHAAYLDVLWKYGPARRTELMRTLLDQLEGGPEAARAFELEIRRRQPARRTVPELTDAETVFAVDRLGEAAATVVIPLFNYAAYVTEALESVKAQTLQVLDLVVVDDASTDDSLSIAVRWARENADRFNRLAVLHHRTNAGLAIARNTGFDAAETDFVLPLDADNRLLPRCVESCLFMAKQSGAGFVYPRIRCFGASEDVIGGLRFEPARLIGGNYIDAMALVAKWAWAAVGGYEDMNGWEDYDFWCRCVEHGIFGAPVEDVLAEYRVHEFSMLRTKTDLTENKRALIAEIGLRHSWLSVLSPG